MSKEIIEKKITNSLKEILNEKDYEDFKKLIPELQDNYIKKQIFRTETEMRIGVLHDAKFPDNASKYWQAVRELDVYFEQLMQQSFAYRKDVVEIKKIEKKLQEEKDPLEKELLQIELDKRIFWQTNALLVAKDRMREIKLWSKVKKEVNDGTFNTQDVNESQLNSLTKKLENKSKTLTPHSGQAEIFNIIGQLDTAKKIKKQVKGLGHKKIKKIKFNT